MISSSALIPSERLLSTLSLSHADKTDLTMKVGLRLDPGCDYCHENRILHLTCGSCGLVSYCSRRHQKADRVTHARSCRRLVSSQECLLVAQAKNVPSKGLDVDYMRASRGIIATTNKVGSRAAAKLQLSHLLTGLKLDRKAYRWIQWEVPLLALRLDRDQEAYTFARCMSGDRDRTLTPLSPSNAEDADVLESIDYLCQKDPNIIAVVPILLLKIKLMLDLLRLNKCIKLIGHRLPLEIFDMINVKIVRSPIVARNECFLEARNHAVLVKKLSAQAEELYRAVSETNESFWPYFLKLINDMLFQIPIETRTKTRRLHFMCEAWVETEWAAEFLLSLSDREAGPEINPGRIR